MSSTRGTGLLEPWLAKLRAHQANRLIPLHLRVGRILDIGCGRRPFFLQNTTFREKFSLDQMPLSTEIQHRHRIRHVTHDLEGDPTLPFDSSGLSVITLLAVLEHLQPEVAVQVLKECHRALIPGGVVIVTTPASWVDSLLRHMAKLRLVSPEEVHEHAFSYSLPTLGVAMGHAGFPMKKFRAGLFELSMNLWAVAEK